MEVEKSRNRVEREGIHPRRQREPSSVEEGFAPAVGGVGCGVG
jgi:hypothetical protein